MKNYWNWGTRVALVYALFALGTIGMVVIAVTHRADLVSPDYYERSLEQDGHVEAVRNAAALGAAFTMRLSDDSRTLLIEGPRDMVAAAGTITMYRASDASADRNVRLAVAADGRQSVPMEGLVAGSWVARASWTLDGRSYFAETPVVVR